MSVLRIIDANANRAREAARVMEEAARFVLDDAALAERLKRLRHTVTEAIDALGRAVGDHRDTPGDVGTDASAPGERERATVAAVAMAAGKRLGEALRAIEEYGKTLDAAWAARIESIRYEGYDLEMRLNQALAAGRARQWRVCVLLSAALCPGGAWEAVARAVVEAGVDCIQLREKDLDDAELLRRARWLVEMAPAGTAVIVNDRPDIALLAGAHGVHLGRDDLPCTEARKLAGDRLLIGVSTAHLDEARAALAAGADYCGVGAMFATETKTTARVVGPGALRDFVAWGRLPHLAIGGVTPANVGQLLAVGGRGIAVSTAVCGAPDPRAVVTKLQNLMTPTGATI